jgi:3-phenylpropionate/trans-cinnamate dioxygenase ferredoxin component
VATTTADGFERVSDHLPAPGELRLATLSDGTALCVGNADGEVFAVQNECTHSAFPLSEGSLLPGGVIQCAWHGARFDCRTGAALQEPAFDALARFEVRILDDEIWARRLP